MKAITILAVVVLASLIDKDFSWALLNAYGNVHNAECLHGSLWWQGTVEQRRFFLFIGPYGIAEC